MHALVLMRINQQTKFDQFQRYDWGKIKKWVTWPWQHPLGGNLSSNGQHLIYSICIQNLASTASAIQEIWLWASKQKMG